jgi:type II secretory pathway pseudopilin PulG
MPGLRPNRTAARLACPRTKAGHFGFWILDFGLVEGLAAHTPHPLAQSKIQNPKSKISPRSGLTLIEMLMATAITLLMMAAVVTLFANLSGSISNRRALIELSGQLRQVRQRLARDLAGCTVPPGPQGLMPWRQRPGEAIGYFEIKEWGHTDWDPSDFVDGAPGNGEIDYGTSLVPSGGDPLTLLPRQVDRRIVDDDDVTNGGGLGDADDILALTVRSLGDPFTAIAPVDLNGDGDFDDDDDGFFDNFDNQRIESNLAEVVWYAREIWPADDASTTDFFENRVNPYDPESAIGEPGMRILYRRELLIAPWLLPIPAGVGPFFGDLPYDGKVSVHRELVNPADLTLGQMWVPNTLADLTRREYRFAHEYILGDPTRIDLDYPHELDLRDINGIYRREYVVLDNALAFDVRVFDPGAPVYLVGATTSPPIDGTPVDPVDAGWRNAVGGAPASYGAYVDLGWNNSGTYDYRTITGAVPTVFQEEHQLGWHPRYPLFPDTEFLFRGQPAVYDTWTWHYENNGRDEDGDAFDSNGDGILDQNIDEGTNGRDDPDPTATALTTTRLNGENGVDDVMERETSPPYPSPLRAVKVVLRVYERDARQIRESSVTNSFAP